MGTLKLIVEQTTQSATEKQTIADYLIDTMQADFDAPDESSFNNLVNHFWKEYDSQYRSKFPNVDDYLEWVESQPANNGLLAKIEKFLHTHLPGIF